MAEDIETLIRESSIVVVGDAKEEARFGTGFIIGHLGELTTLLLTCAHVVDAIKDKSSIRVKGRPAKIIANGSGDRLDLAILLVEGKLEGIELNCHFNVSDEDIRTVSINGFRYLDKSRELRELRAVLEPEKIRFETNHNNICAWEFTIQNGKLDPGYSGSPVILPKTRKVVGIAIIRESEKARVIAIDALKLLWNEIHNGFWKSLNNGERGNSMMTIFQAYRTAKQEVLQLYETCKDLVNDQEDLADLEGKIARLKNEKYTLVVAGEVKAGKSTFINALLGDVVLPTGFLQNTSAIIKIAKHEQKFVRVEFADESVEKVIELNDGLTERTVQKPGYSEENTNEAPKLDQFLNQVAAIREEYRRIPLQKLNVWLMENKGEFCNQDTESLIPTLENDYNLSPEDFQRLVIKYLDEFKGLNKIPVEIQVGYPLRDEFEEVQIVDTPGVNALGGVEELTFDYLSNNANAIVFLQSSEVIEKRSTKKFAKDQITKKSRNVLFLVLTKTGDSDIDAVNEKMDSARELYADTINPNQITYIDSLFKVISDEGQRFPSLDALKKSYDKNYVERKRQFDQAKSEGYPISSAAHTIIRDKINLLSSSLREIKAEQSDESTENAITWKNILEKSNFNKVEEMLSQFASEAPFEFLHKIAEDMKAIYTNQEEDCSKAIEFQKKKLKSPEDCQKEIEEFNRELSHYEENLKRFLKELEKKYLSNDAPWRERLKRYKSSFRNAIKEIDDKDEAKAEIEDLMDRLERLSKKQIISPMYDELNEEMSKGKIKIKLSKYLFDPPKVRLKKTAKKVDEAARKEVLKDDPYIDEEDIETDKRYQKTLRRNLRKKCRRQFEDFIRDAEDEMEENISKFCKKARAKLEKLVDEKKAYLESLLQEQKGYEDMMVDIERLYEKLDKLKTQLMKIEIILKC